MVKEKLDLLEKPTTEILQGYYAEPIENEESSFIESLRKLREYTPLPSEREKKQRAIVYVLRRWFSQKMREKYDEMLPELFELKQEIVLNIEHFGDEHVRYRINRERMGKANIPVFAWAELNKDTSWKHEQDHKIDTDAYKIYLSSNIPRIPLEVRNAGRTALALAYKTYGDALVTEVINDIMTANPDYAPKPENAQLIALWKPKPEEIHVEVKAVDRDPALLLKYDKLYLVSTWREPNEEPFMIYLQNI